MNDIDTLNERLKELNSSLDVIKKYGFDEEVLTAYLCFKLKITKKKASEIINVYEEFFNKTIKRAMFKGI